MNKEIFSEVNRNNKQFLQKTKIDKKITTEK